ncbi:DUF29 family protein [Spirosoma montaniterrae]|uniref:CTLH domain-containing protein n=1 Tax=Spirosoma montaniterrae TaxID=1178516 RepID=A0A1P9X0P7_9BACT|nr:DUF29 family protein [Spirosoma montaniterrae]AQG81192.1 hypothetical protein AWR27_18830 [Spirosoma montaniterrae]
MDELLELRQAITEGRYADALHIVDELDEMARDDKTNKIFSFMEILLIHLIKKSAEQRTTRSWENSINHAVAQIQRTNKRRKSGGFYQTNAELLETLHEAFVLALPQAAIEAFEGTLSDDELLAKIDRNQIIGEAMRFIEH